MSKIKLDQSCILDIYDRLATLGRVMQKAANAQEDKQKQQQTFPSQRSKPVQKVKPILKK